VERGSQVQTGTWQRIASWARLPVERRWLFEISGVIWSAVGLLCLGYAVVWLSPVGAPLLVGLAAAGLLTAAAFMRFVFLGIVRKNIARIEDGPTRASAFAFQGWKSYLVTVLMVAMGITLRHSAVPKPYLAVIYEGVGAALLLTSLLYHRRFAAALRPRRP
jgi:hypothetical protein